MIGSVVDSGSIPALERLAQFAGARHRLIVHNVANLSTPNFRPVDVSVRDFQRTLGEAIDRRREAGRVDGPLPMPSTDQVRVEDDGLTLRPEPIGGNVLFHDGNDRDLERTMQALNENFLVFQQAMDLLRSRYAMLDTAIRGRL